MPRVEGEDVIYRHETWTKILGRNLGNIKYTIVDFPQRARDTESLKFVQVSSESIPFSNPSIVIRQLGIVDCAPRIFSKKESKILKKYFLLTKLRNIIINFRKRKKEKILNRASLKKVHVSPSNFKNNLIDFIEKIKSINLSVKITLILIVGHFAYLENKAKGYSENINLFNSIIAEIGTLKSYPVLNDFPSKMNDAKYYKSDGYHLNQKGHNFIANGIHQWLENNLTLANA